MYVVAFTLGALCILQPCNATDGRVPAGAIPMPEAVMVMDAFSAALATFLEAEWHIVFKG